MRHLAIGFCALLLLASAGNERDANAQSLETEPISLVFQSSEPMQITIEVDLDKLLDDRSQDSEYRPARFSYISEEGDSLSFDAKIKTRGNFRLKKSHCDFPPIKLNLKKKEMEGTVFDDNDKFKLVTHCDSRRDAYEEYVLQEYLVYRSYNLLTDISFQVRLARVTYVDSENDREPLSRFAFLIEDNDDLADRLNARLVEQKGISPRLPSPSDMMRVAVFQYLIGNTDWSVSVLHNVELIKPVDQSILLPVPFDFDFSGVINTRYATPDPKLGIDSVEERMYRGICRSSSQLEPVLEVFREKKDAIYDLYGTFPYLRDKVKRRTLEYFDEFYSTINNERRVRAEFEDRCARMS